MSDLALLCQRLGYTFQNQALLKEAVSHRSSGSRNYERLEFLGDSFLNFVIAEALYQQNKSLDEGTLSRQRASLVRGSTLAEIARSLELGQFLTMGVGELKSGGFNRDSILADLVEALIGACLCDSSYEEARALVLRLFEGRLQSLPNMQELKDPKTRLQELLQGQGLGRPEYAVVKTTGKSHELEFTVTCSVASFDIEFTAVASSRRKAEQAAALEALEACQARLTVS
ncbi:MAG: ribonuclease III [Granulosicoccus sp.]|nr:ribonuclease III [Granulosicoccus sp.]